MLTSRVCRDGPDAKLDLAAAAETSHCRGIGNHRGRVPRDADALSCGPMAHGPAWKHTWLHLVARLP